MLDKTAETNINVEPNRQHLPPSLWTDERVEQLKKLWTEGRTATQAAAVLGGFEHCDDGGRSAICGKVHRLGLSGRVRENSSIPRRTRSTAATQSNTARRITKTLKVRSPSNGGVVVVESIVREEAPPRADFLGIALLDLEQGMCRFPRGAGPSISFCGQKTISGESWCRNCYKIVYLPPRPPVARAYHPLGSSKPAVF